MAPASVPLVDTQQRPSLRLGIYVDAEYAQGEGDRLERIAVDPIDFAFLVFAEEVGRRVGDVVMLGRLNRGPIAATYVSIPDQFGFVPLPHYPNLRALRALAKAVLGTTYAFWRALDRLDAVWVFGPHPFALLLIAVAAARRRRIVLGVRQDTLVYYRSRVDASNWSRVRAGVWLLDAGFRVAAQLTKTTVVGSQIARRYGAPRNGVHQMTVSLVRAEDVPTDLEPRDWAARIELLSVSRFDPEKNPLLLVEAMQHLEVRRPGKYHLTWVGGGRLDGVVRTKVAELGLRESISFRGQMSFGPELLRLYRESHAFIHISLTEGVPQVVLESMACGTSLVATDVGGVADAVASGEAAVLVPPGDVAAVVDAIIRLTDDEPLRERLRHRALELARDRTLETEADHVARFIAG